MNVNIGETIKLENGIKHVVFSKADYKGKTYLGIIDFNENIKVCYQEDDKLYIVDLDSLDMELINLLIKEGRNSIDINS